MKKCAASLFIILLYSCTNTGNETEKALFPKILNVYGSEHIKENKISFNVDHLSYTVLFNDSKRLYETKTLTKDSVKMRAVSNNGHQQYFVNGTLQKVGTYSQKLIDIKLDGFLYAQLIPTILQQNATVITQKEDVTIRRKKYNVLHVSYKVTDLNKKQEFYLYVQPETKLIEFMACDYYALSDKKLFRRYINFRDVNKIKFADYYTFTTFSDTVPLSKLYRHYNTAQLQEIGKTELKNINTIPTKGQ
ncbi:MAG: DUF6503 family protein [Marinirhabdus sp.]